MLIMGYVNHFFGETPSNLRMGVPNHVTKFDGLSITLTNTKRKATINAPYQSGQYAHKLEEWLEMQPQRFGINADSYNAYVSVFKTLE
jgi:predicted oxidoreductase